MASIFYYGSIFPQERGNNCAERISQTNVAVVENLRLNIEKIQSLGWEPKISLEQGIKETIESFKIKDNF